MITTLHRERVKPPIAPYDEKGDDGGDDDLITLTLAKYTPATQAGKEQFQTYWDYSNIETPQMGPFDEIDVIASCTELERGVLDGSHFGSISFRNCPQFYYTTFGKNLHGDLLTREKNGSYYLLAAQSKEFDVYRLELDTMRETEPNLTPAEFDQRWKDIAESAKRLYSAKSTSPFQQITVNESEFNHMLDTLDAIPGECTEEYMMQLCEVYSFITRKFELTTNTPLVERLSESEINPIYERLLGDTNYIRQPTPNIKRPRRNS